MSVTYLPTGNMILSKGVAKDSGRTAAMKSLEGATHVLIEEADEIPEAEFDQMDLSLRTMEANQIEIIRIFNPPPKKHWIWRDYILDDFIINIRGTNQTFYRARPRIGSGILSIWGTYYDNLANIHPTTVSKFESFKETNQSTIGRLYVGISRTVHVGVFITAGILSRLNSSREWSYCISTLLTSGIPLTPTH